MTAAFTQPQTQSPQGDLAAKPSAGTSVKRQVPLDRIPRPIRFAAVGATCALLQLLTLDLLIRLGLEPHATNALAFLLSAQVNFLLSTQITWRDRLSPTAPRATLWRRLGGYNLLALGSLAINQLVFALALPFTHYLVASTLGILVGMLLTYAISGNFLFRRHATAR